MQSCCTVLFWAPLIHLGFLPSLKHHPPFEQEPELRALMQVRGPWRRRPVRCRTPLTKATSPVTLRPLLRYLSMSFKSMQSRVALLPWQPQRLLLSTAVVAFPQILDSMDTWTCLFFDCCEARGVWALQIGFSAYLPYALCRWGLEELSGDLSEQFSVH